MRQRRLRAETGGFELFERGQAETTRFEEAPFVHEQDGLIQVDERWPDLVVLADHPLARLGKQLDGAEGLALLAVGGGGIGQRLRRLVAHAQLVEAAVGLLGHLARIDTQVELEIDLREVEQRQCGVIAVAGSLRGGRGRMEQLDRAAVFTAQVVEPGDVVVGLTDGLIEAALRGQPSRFLVRGQRIAEVVQRRQRDGLVVDGGQHAVGVAERAAPDVRARSGPWRRQSDPAGEAGCRS